MLDQLLALSYNKCENEAKTSELCVSILLKMHPWFVGTENVIQGNCKEALSQGL